MNGRFVQRFVRVLTSFILAAFLLAVAAAKSAYASGALVLSETNVMLQENCTVAYDGGNVTVTDTDDNNDVWSSKLLLDAGLELTAGERYKISFELAGENGAGEFFLCRSENMDDRYDETFASETGSRSITFTAAGNRVFIGMQVGNLGKGHSVTAAVQNLCRLSESEFPQLLRTENCSVSVADGVITATDMGDNNDVWNSKILYDAGVALEIGKTYRLDLNLAGDSGVGECFVCKSPNLNDRYDATFTNAAGERTVTFKAESETLYIGMQFGNLGKGNSVTAGIGAVSETVPAEPQQGNGPVPDAEAVNCSYTVQGNVITVTDLGDNNDVWNSSLLYDAGVELEVGKQYEIRFTLSGDNGVGEFFLCRSKDLNDRYDGTFTSANGEKAVAFTATGARVYIGMQVGNLGEGNSATATIVEIREYDKAAQAEPRVMTAENCTYQVDTSNNQTVIEAVDTSDNNDVWNSKLLYCLGEILDVGKFYAANFNLAGENGVGEFFFCKTNSLDDRYSFDSTAGDHTAKFTAEDSLLYAGMQFGNIGEDNAVTLTIQNIFRIPGLWKSGESCSESFAQDAVTITDTSDNNDVWNSKAIYDTGITLVPGTTYTATFTLSGDNGVGEFFFLKTENIDNRYTYNNAAGTHTVTFTAEDTGLFFGIQCGNLGNGNSVTLSNLSVTPVEEPLNLMMAAAPQGNGAEGAPAEEPAAQEGETPAEEPAEQEGETPAEEPAQEESGAPAEEPGQKTEGE